MDEWFKDWFDEDYAALYAHRDEAEARRAVATALRLAPELGSGPVLDLGCGSGRHLVELRRANPRAFGMDLSGPLLRLAEETLRGSLVRGDMRHLPVKAAGLAGLCLWFTPFGYFGDEANKDLLHALAQALRPGGVLLLDYLNAHQLRRHLVQEDVAERAGLRVHSRRSLEEGRVIKRMTLTRLDSGATREVVESVRVYEPDELEALARPAGFRLRTALGSYEGASFVEASPRWIALFVRP